MKLYFLQDMALQQTALVETRTMNVAGVPVAVTIEILNSFGTDISFVLHGKSYTFPITKWAGKGMGNFLLLFYGDRDRDRDEAKFGKVEINDDGILIKAPETHFKQQAVVQACVDIIECINKISQVHGRALLDYAVWYREKHQVVKTYSDYITKLACHSIAHADFLAPDATFNLVKF